PAIPAVPPVLPIRRSPAPTGSSPPIARVAIPPALIPWRGFFMVPGPGHHERPAERENGGRREALVCRGSRRTWSRETEEDARDGPTDEFNQSRSIRFPHAARSGARR